MYPNALAKIGQIPRETPLKGYASIMIQQDKAKIDICGQDTMKLDTGIMGLNIAGTDAFLEQVPRRNLDKNRIYQDARSFVNKQTLLRNNIDDFRPTSRWKLES